MSVRIPPLGPCLEPSWRPLEPSWGPPGPSWAPWGRLGALPPSPSFLLSFLMGGGTSPSPDGVGGERSERAWVALAASEPELAGEHESMLGACVAWVATPRAGAVATFSGVTRESFGGRRVLRLEYEAYAPMALRELKRICGEVLETGCERVAVLHRLGEVGVGGTSVAIAASSAHRAPALAAVQHAIDAVKASAPIWKKEFCEDGEVWKENAEWEGGQRRLVQVSPG